MKVPVALCTVTGVVAVGFVLYIVGMSTPHWMDKIQRIEEHDGPYSEHYREETSAVGMFKICIDGTLCRSLVRMEIPSYYKACQAMIILGLIAAFLSLCTTCVGWVYTLRSRPVPRIIVYACLCGGAATLVFTIITIPIWIKKFYSPIADYVPESNSSRSPPSISLGYSFALVIVGAIMVMAGGCGFWYSSRSVSDAEGLLPLAEVVA